VRLKLKMRRERKVGGEVEEIGRNNRGGRDKGKNGGREREIERERERV
jgi:hypothetical protein